MSYTTIEEGSEATPGLWNSRFRDLWNSVNTVIDTGYSAVTAVKVSDYWHVQSGMSLSNLTAGSISMGTGSFAAENFFLAKSASANLLQLDIPADGSFLVQGANYAKIEYNGTLSLTTGLVMGTSQVLSTRKTGWAVPSGTLGRGTFVTSTATLGDVAQRLAALIVDLTLHGLIGA